MGLSWRPIEAYCIEAEEAFTLFLERMYPQGESVVDTKEYVIAKIVELRDKEFSGDTRRMFDHYSHDGALSQAELMLVLLDAGIGNRLTRGRYVKAILEAVDKNEDQSISADELNAVIQGN